MNVMKLKEIILVLLALMLSTNNVLAFQNCQLKYDSDKRSLPSKRGQCSICHINPSGSGPQNEFGLAFKNAGFKITDELVTKFPNLFQKPEQEPLPSVNTSSSSGSLEAPKPTIKRIKPTKVKVNVQSMISIMGKNFTLGSKAFIDNNEVLTTFKSSVLLIADFILNTLGLHEVKVKNSDGGESNTVKLKTK